METQRVVQREQGTVNREQEKPRTGCYNQDKGYVPAKKNEARNPRRPCNNGIYAAKQVLLAAIGSYDFEIRAAATIPVPCSLFPVPSSPRQISIYPD